MPRIAEGLISSALPWSGVHCLTTGSLGRPPGVGVVGRVGKALGPLLAATSWSGLSHPGGINLGSRSAPMGPPTGRGIRFPVGTTSPAGVVGTGRPPMGLFQPSGVVQPRSASLDIVRPVAGSAVCPCGEKRDMSIGERVVIPPTAESGVLIVTPPGFSMS